MQEKLIKIKCKLTHELISKMLISDKQENLKLRYINEQHDLAKDPNIKLSPDWKSSTLYDLMKKLHYELTEKKKSKRLFKID